MFDKLRDLSNQKAQAEKVLKSTSDSLRNLQKQGQDLLGISNPLFSNRFIKDKLPYFFIPCVLIGIPATVIISPILTLILTLVFFVFMFIYDKSTQMARKIYPKFGQVVQFEDNSWAFCRGFFNPGGDEPGTDAVVYSERYNSQEEASSVRDRYLNDQEMKEKSNTVKNYS